MQVVSPLAKSCHAGNHSSKQHHIKKKNSQRFDLNTFSGYRAIPDKGTAMGARVAIHRVRRARAAMRLFADLIAAFADLIAAVMRAKILIAKVLIAKVLTANAMFAVCPVSRIFCLCRAYHCACDKTNRDAAADFERQKSVIKHEYPIIHISNSGQMKPVLLQPPAMGANTHASARKARICHIHTLVKRM